MNVTLPASLEEFVRSKVAEGRFASTEEALCEGLRLLQIEEEWTDSAREKIEFGWRQAKSGQLLSPEQVRENLLICKRGSSSELHMHGTIHNPN